MISSYCLKRSTGGKSITDNATEENESSLEIRIADSPSNRQTTAEEQICIELVCLKEESAIDKLQARADYATLLKKKELLRERLEWEGWCIICTGKIIDFTSSKDYRGYYIIASRNILEKQKEYLESLLAEGKEEAE